MEALGINTTLSAFCTVVSGSDRNTSTVSNHSLDGRYISSNNPRSGKVAENGHTFGYGCHPVGDLPTQVLGLATYVQFPVASKHPSIDQELVANVMIFDINRSPASGEGRNTTENQGVMSFQTGRGHLVEYSADD
ncbi:hypothetical protein MKZ38_006984 [Zalerion maritima]|uniref:Uncharacterized protein n=1 Tax=Zalerion maritima TaxID=339359 RepID=A0AAD5RJH6_9PEZI|nr:hypothetical protein MKZ38_006984 [Zalerion maritima]